MLKKFEPRNYSRNCIYKTFLWQQERPTHVRLDLNRSIKHPLRDNSR